jgi:DNA-binding beta-propeller fold protein YncE
VVRRGTLKVPVDVEFVPETGPRTRKTWDGEAEWTLMDYDGTSPLRAAIVDPDRKVLLDQNAVNNFVSVRGLDKKSAPRSNTRLWTLGNILLRLVAP